VTLEPTAILELHRDLVGIPSRSGEEAAILGYAAGWLTRHEVGVRRLNAALLATVGSGPLLLFDTHLDTVPAGPGWTRDPHRATREPGRVYGLGANDAKASAAAMAAAFVALAAAPPRGVSLGLALVGEEETRGTGTQEVLAELARRATPPAAAVIGEPTDLELAVAQKGLLIVELVARGSACHAAHRRSLGLLNPAVELARDLVALAELELAPEHPLLGATTLEPTVLRAGEARNAIPGEAAATLDLRTTPAAGHLEVVEGLRAVARCEVRVVSDRLRPRETRSDAAVVRAARQARPQARLVGSPTLSDLVFFDAPAVKVGPGSSTRSHTDDEWVYEEEVLAAAAFYERLARAWAALEGESLEESGAAVTGRQAEPPRWSARRG
jgi:acetylornithine deacetylase